MCIVAPSSICSSSRNVASNAVSGSGIAGRICRRRPSAIGSNAQAVTVVLRTPAGVRWRPALVMRVAVARGARVRDGDRGRAPAWPAAATGLRRLVCIGLCSRHGARRGQRHSVGPRPLARRARARRARRLRAHDRPRTANRELMAERIRPADVVLLHDPQTAGMIPRLLGTGVPVIWRAHVGLDPTNDLARQAWRFLIPYVERADAYVFSHLAYLWEGLDPTKLTVIAPSIDAFSPKNHAMAFTSVTAVLRAAGLASDHHQGSRAVFERLDGTVGRVTSEATLVEEQQLRLDECRLGRHA